jgi:hypothetical protein
LLIGFFCLNHNTFNAIANTTIQKHKPDHLRGRVIVVYMLVFNGSIPLGNLFTGGLAHLFGAPIALLAGAAPSLIAAVAGWIFRSSAEKDVAQSLTKAE